MSERPETGWLIESKSPSDAAPIWFCAGRGGFNWTRDASAAIRFARREDAQGFADWCAISAWPDVGVTEHQWMDRKEPLRTRHPVHRPAHFIDPAT